MDKVKKYVVFDTSIATQNMGDFIIMDAVWRELYQLDDKAMYLTAPTHDIIGKSTWRNIYNSEICFVGGTNILSSNIFKYRQWRLRLIDLIFLRGKVVLLGVGWWQYQAKPSLFTRIILRYILSKNFSHSVRDSYTEAMLRAIGIKNVINTSCPTMWNLGPQHNTQISSKKSQDVIFTLTDYNQDAEKDSMLIQTLVSNYSQVYFWPQGTDDLKYLATLKNYTKVIILGSNLKSFDNLLFSNESVDYIGTRLHAGIRALQYKKRTIIIGIDNRAGEKAKDFKLKVLFRAEIDKLSSCINSGFSTDLEIPHKKIATWKASFGNKK